MSAMETLAHAVMTKIPPNAIDRQVVCTLLSRAESSQRQGKHKDCAKLLMQAGAALFKLGHPQAIGVAESIFTAAVKHAKIGDEGETPDYMKVVLEGGQTELGDAYTWLGTCENRLGKPTDAEGHYKAAARAVEDEGIATHADKFVHRVMLCRLRKDFERHKQLCDAWEETIRKAAKDGSECETALLAATGICLQERAAGLADQEKVLEAAQVRGGKFLETVTRLQAHGLRQKPDVNLSNVYDSVAALYLRAKEQETAIKFLRKCVLATASQEGFIENAVPLGVARAERAMDSWEDVCWHPSLLYSTKSGEEVKDVVPQKPYEMSADENKIFEKILRIGENWNIKKGTPGKEWQKGANQLGHMLLALGNQLFLRKETQEASRVLKTAASMFVHDTNYQATAMHWFGSCVFQNAKANPTRIREILPEAAQAFAVAAECRVGGGGNPTKKDVSEGISSLLFLGRVLFELGSFVESERVINQAITLGRKVLGDEAKETADAIRAMMELKKQLAAIANRQRPS